MARDTADLSASYNYSAVTPSDSTNLSNVTRAIYVGGDGNMVCVKEDGNTVTFTGVKAGSWYPIRCKRVNSTNTTATNIVALF